MIYAISQNRPNRFRIYKTVACNLEAILVNVLTNKTISLYGPNASFRSCEDKINNVI